MPPDVASILRSICVIYTSVNDHKLELYIWTHGKVHTSMPYYSTTKPLPEVLQFGSQVVRHDFLQFGLFVRVPEVKGQIVQCFIQVSVNGTCMYTMLKVIIMVKS